MKEYKLLKTFDADGSYEAEHNKAFVIEKIGTDQASDFEIHIDKKLVGIINSWVAPAVTTSSNFLQLLNLKDLFLVLPPEYSLEFKGTSGKHVVCQGKIIVLDPGETLPAAYLTRFGQQHNLYYKAITGTEKSTGTSWAAGSELEVYSLTPTTPEKYVFDNVIGLHETTAGSPATTLGDIGIILKLDDIALDILKTTMGYLGIEFFKVRIPCDLAVSKSVPFLDPYKVEVLGDHTFKVIIRNVSGGALYGTTAAGFTFRAVARYSKFV